MKIGILTFWWSSDNYGQLLQCFALQKYLTDNGHEVFLIKYNYHNEFEKKSLIRKFSLLFNPLKLRKSIVHNINKLFKIDEKREFAIFKNTYIKQSSEFYKTYDKLRDCPPEADIYIVGSDQVWNLDYYRDIKSKAFNNIVNSYFLNFGTAKKVAYAASWGKTEISSEQKIIISKLINQFDYISVREESGIKLCSDCGYTSSVWNCDPTLLLSSDIYRSIYKSYKIRLDIKEPYILLYMLNKPFNFKIKMVYEFAKKNNLNVIPVTGNSYFLTNQIFPSIQEWLYLIDNAEYVVTDSFHCCLFSLLFNKKVGVVPLTGKHIQMNERFYSLFKLLKINPRLIKDNLEVLKEDYKAVFPNADFADIIKLL